MNAALWLLLIAPFAVGLAAEGDTAPWARAALSQGVQAARDIPDPFHRAQALTEIAEAHTSSGALQGARENLQLAADTARQIDNPALASWARHDIALALLRAEDSAGAEAMATALTDLRLRDAVFGRIADSRRAARDLDGALDAARRIQDPARQGHSLRAIAVLQASSGDLADALATARSIVHGPTHALALGDVAAALAKDGSFDEARQLAARVRDAQSRSEAFAEVATAQAEAGDVWGALSTAREVQDKLTHAQVLARVAAARANSGSAAEARDMLPQLLATATRTRASAERKCDVLLDVARAQIALRDPAAARETLGLVVSAFDKVRSNSRRLVLISRTVPLQAKVSDFDGALRTALRADDASLRPLLVRDVTLAQAEAGKVAEAIAVAGSVQDAEAGTAAYFGILRAQSRAGDSAGLLATIDVALRAARAIGSVELRAGALGGLAAAQSAAGDTAGAQRTFEEAMTAASSADRPQQRAVAYARIADALTDRRDAISEAPRPVPG